MLLYMLVYAYEIQNQALVFTPLIIIIINIINNDNISIISSNSKPSSILYWPFQGGTSVVVSYCYLFLLSVFILWFSYYVSDIFCKF